MYCQLSISIPFFIFTVEITIFKKILFRVQKLQKHPPPARQIAHRTIFVEIRAQGNPFHGGLLRPAGILGAAQVGGSLRVGGSREGDLHSKPTVKTRIVQNPHCTPGCRQGGRRAGGRRGRSGGPSAARGLGWEALVLWRTRQVRMGKGGCRKESSG